MSERPESKRVPPEATAALPASQQPKHAPSRKPTRDEQKAAARLAVEKSAQRYVVQRPLDQRGWGTAIGAGIVAGLITSYLTGIWMGRAPLTPRAPRAPAATRRPPDAEPRRDG